MTTANEVLQIAYPDRQLIVVLSDADFARSRAALALKWGGSMLLDHIATYSIKNVLFPSLRPFGRLQSWVGMLNGPPLRFVSREQALCLSLPMGHPRGYVVYVGHPAEPATYYLLADFHRHVFEHKLSEAIRLLMSLGAISICAEHKVGWGHEFSANLSLPITAGTTAEATAGEKGNASNAIVFTASLAGSMTPSIPDDLVWFKHEPTWQTVANGRMKYGLKSFTLEIVYKDDHGINVGLKTKLGSMGLDVGGKFEEHQSTVWKLTGDFASEASST